MIPVDLVIREVERTLAKVKEKSSDIHWQTIELTLETVVKQGAATSIEFWVVSAEATVNDSVTQTVYYKLVPKVGINATQEVLPPFSEQLSRAIIEADSNMRRAIEQSQNLDSAGSYVSIRFAVDTSRTGAGKVELVPIQVGTKGTRASTAAHTIKITF